KILGECLFIIHAPQSPKEKKPWQTQCHRELITAFAGSYIMVSDYQTAICPIPRLSAYGRTTP
ncbi:hypothetical protein KAT51_05575, partial [bacterium]|nr:hypothetical protein [bacterium]